MDHHGKQINQDKYYDETKMRTQQKQQRCMCVGGGGEEGTKKHFGA